MTREEKLIDKGTQLRGYLQESSNEVRASLDALKEAVRAGDTRGIGQAVSAVRRAERGLKNKAKRVHIPPGQSGGGPPGQQKDKGKKK